MSLIHKEEEEEKSYIMHDWQKKDNDSNGHAVEVKWNLYSIYKCSKNVDMHAQVAVIVSFSLRTNKNHVFEHIESEPIIVIAHCACSASVKSSSSSSSSISNWSFCAALLVTAGSACGATTPSASASASTSCSASTSSVT